MGKLHVFISKAHPGLFVTFSGSEDCRVVSRICHITYYCFQTRDHSENWSAKKHVVSCILQRHL